MPEVLHALTAFTPRHDWFVGVDSDGTTFDTMEIKHKECFIPTIVEIWDLQFAADKVRETAEFINLYSKWRGIDRWRGLVMTFDLLRARGVTVPEIQSLRAFVSDDSYPKSNAGLKAYLAAHPAPELKAALEWSTRVNALFAAKTRHVTPLPYVRECLETLSKQADLVVVSSMPQEDLEHEWSENDLVKYTSGLGAQETGSKSAQLRLAAKGKYRTHHILMIGDAPGDMQAAYDNGALFYPIDPGREASAWKRFYDEGMDKFLRGEFAGLYEESLVARFRALLPDTPPWDKA